MSFRTYLKSIGVAVLALAVITGCGGGGDINFNLGTNGWNNWPWPWQSDADVFASKTYSENVPVNGPTNLLLNGINGAVTITGVPGRETVTVTAEVRVGSTTLVDAQIGLNQLDVALAHTGSNIVVRTEQPANPLGRQYIVDYDITVPSDLSLSVNLVNGYVDIDNMSNSVYVDVENGDVNFADVHGDSSISIENGSFYGFLSLNTDSEVLISTVNGDIDLDIPATTSADFFAQVTSGSIAWENLDLANPHATSKTLQGILGDGSGLIDLETVNGNISIIGL